MNRLAKNLLLGIAASLLVSGPVSAQSEIFETLPSVDGMVRMLDGQKNIFAVPSGESLVVPAKPDPAAAAPAVDRPSGVCTTPPDGEAGFGVPVQFAINSAELPAPFRRDLVRLAEALEQLPGAVIEIGGHTDVSGGDAINIPLSQRRAASVFSALVNEHGVDPARLRAVGYGSSKLCVADAPRDPINRRVGFRRL